MKTGIPEKANVFKTNLTFMDLSKNGFLCLVFETEQTFKKTSGQTERFINIGLLINKPSFY